MKAAVFVALFVAAISAVAVPNVLEYINRENGKHTAADMRTIATAWEARATDFNTYAVGPPGPVASEDLRRVLEPTYVRQMPQFDGWGRSFVFWTSGQEYSLRSAGADGKLDPHAARGATTNFDCDLIYSNGEFVSYPLASCQE